MALYIVVHHNMDTHQPWVNSWHDDDCIEAIQTTTEIGRLCEKSRKAGEAVFVHRCGWGGHVPCICCSAHVARVDAIDRRTSLVRFRNAESLAEIPPISPVRGQNYYIA